MITIPWMLLVNPYLLWKDEKDRVKARASNGGDVELNAIKSDYEVFNDEAEVNLLKQDKTNFSRIFVV